ncbi:MAG: hypothetical protein KDN05_17540, partial [Verrucomicrobiae bacterium]|nr:hypothetical protein [Verrucomicrobiae bacterium]
MGYSGVPGRDARNGFSVAGPSYDADQKAKLAEAKAAGLRYPHKVGIDMKFHAKAPEKPLDLSVEEIKKRIAAQVQEVAADESICWWYLTPEELRHWRENEMEYLQAATEAIRAADPMGRPIWMYEPNHRDAASLAKTGRFLDIIGKGFYTNLAGYRDNRIWVRWSIEQETDAIESMGNGGSGKVPIVMPELCADPEDPSLDHLIPAWTRHDTYLGLMCGGKGVAIWSLFPRNEVKRTWRIWYDSYSAIARELTGPSGLGQVFLHGIAEPVVEVSILDGPKELALTKGARNSLETTTTSEAEKAEALVTYPALCVTQLRHNGHTYIFLCNSSSDSTIKYQSTPLPEGGTITDVFPFRPYQPTNGKLYGWIAP